MINLVYMKNYKLEFVNNVGKAGVGAADFEIFFKRGLKILAGESHLKDLMQGGEVVLTLVDDATIQKINCDYRGKNEPTDVVSLSYIEDEIKKHQNLSKSKSRVVSKGLASASLRVAPPSGAFYWLGHSLCECLVGEIFISEDTAIRQAREHKKTLKQELQFLFTHGLLHIFGYDHQKLNERRVMFDLQDEILQTKSWREITG